MVDGLRLVDADLRPTIDEVSVQANIGIGRILNRDNCRMNV
jgi:hypothetical protein